MPTAFTILKHDARIGPGYLLDRCSALDPPARVVTVTEPDKLPMGIECQGVLTVGRSLDPAVLAAKDPLIRAQVEFVRSLVGLGVPYLGIDRGAQLLSLAMLGTLAPEPMSTMGAGRLTLTSEAAADPLLGGFASEGLPVLSWPTHRITLPRRGVLLAGAPEAPDAFRVGNVAWGILPHPELTALALRDWLEEPDGPGHGVAEPERAALLEAADRSEEDRRDASHRLMDAFLSVTRTFRHAEPPLAALHLGPDHHL